MPLQPLIPPERRSAALVAAVLSALVVVVLAVLVHGKGHTAVDDSITRWVYVHLRSRWMAHATLDISEPALDVGVLGALAVAALLRRAWNVAAFAVLGPTAAVLVSELALKPLVHRQMGDAGSVVANAYPSGHETGVAAVGTVLAVLALRSGWQRGVQIAVMTALGLWALFAAVGLSRNFIHYPSDTVGGAGVAVALVLATALAIDALTGRRRPMADAHDRPVPERRADGDRPS